MTVDREKVAKPMTDTQEEVKPCPFCGSVPNVAQIENDGSNDDWAVECCGCDWVCTDTYFGRKNAITAWNTRPTEEALRAEILTLIANYGQLIEDNRALRARVEELTALATDLARSLECEIKGNYSDEVLEHPVMKRRFDRDMSEVIEARSILNK